MLTVLDIRIAFDIGVGMGAMRAEGAVGAEGATTATASRCIHPPATVCCCCCVCERVRERERQRERECVCMMYDVCLANLVYVCIRCHMSQVCMYEYHVARS